MESAMRLVASWLAVGVICGWAAGCGGDGGDDDVGAGDGGGVVDGGAADATVGPAATVLRIHYPAGAEVVIVRGAGLPGGWMVGMSTMAGGAGGGGADVWTYATTTLAAPTEWKPLLGDLWSLGANYHVTPGQTVDVYPHFKTSRGQVMQFASPFASTVLGNSRVVWAYLPPVYLENTTVRLPVVYMHDGQNLFDAARAFGGVEWQVDETLDAAAAGGRCQDAGAKACMSDGDCNVGGGGGAGVRCESFRESIVIAPENAGAARIYEYTPTFDASYDPSGGADEFLQMLRTELKPRVDTMLRTLPGPADTAVVGSSLGGLLSAYAGVVQPGTFGLVGAMSPSTWWDGRVIIARVMTTPAAGAGAGARPLRVYVDSGDAGSSMDGVTDTRALAQAYLARGYLMGQDFLHVVAPGHQHSEGYWAQRLPGALGFLLGPRER